MLPTDLVCSAIAASVALLADRGLPVPCEHDKLAHAQWQVLHSTSNARVLLQSTDALRMSASKHTQH